MVKKPTGSAYFYIPHQLVKKLGWKKGDYIVIELNEDGETLKIRKAIIVTTETGVKHV